MSQDLTRRALLKTTLGTAMATSCWPPAAAPCRARSRPRHRPSRPTPRSPRPRLPPRPAPPRPARLQPPRPRLASRLQRSSTGRRPAATAAARRTRSRSSRSSRSPPAGESVKVNLTAVPESGYDDKMNTALATGSGLPDVGVISNADWFPKIADLRSYISRDKIDLGMYSKSHFDIHCRFLDQIIALPMGIGATMYFYNTTLLDQKGVKAPQWGYTMEQFLADALKIGTGRRRSTGRFGSRPSGAPSSSPSARDPSARTGPRPRGS